MKNSGLILVLGLVLTFFSLIACNKEKQIQNNLVGNWELNQCKIIDPQGFESYYDAVGTLVIDPFVNGQSTFTIYCTYEVINGAAYTENFSGTMNSAGKSTELESIFNLENQIEEGLSVILYHGKDDIKIEFRSPSKRIGVIGKK